MFDFLRDRYKHNVDKYQQDQELKIVNDVLDAINEQTPQCVDNRQMSFYKLKCEIPKIKQLVETNDERINRYSYVSFKNLLEENIKLKKCNEALESQLEMLKKHFNKDEIKKQEFLNKYKDCSAEKLQRYIELSDVYIESGMKSILENIENCEFILNV
jgi:predicted RNase H-like nuclease (RuvC/YqgF family)